MAAADGTKPLHGVFKALLKGARDRGDGGVLYVKGDECAYRFAHEFRDAGFRKQLEEVLESDDARGLLFVVEERDAALHLLAYPAKQVWADAAAAVPSVVEEVADPD